MSFFCGAPHAMESQRDLRAHSCLAFHLTEFMAMVAGQADEIQFSSLVRDCAVKLSDRVHSW